MSLYDTHVHFDELLARTDLQSVLAEAGEVRGMIAVGGSPSANEHAASLALSYPGRIKASAAHGRQMAVDEHDTSGLERLLNEHRWSAIGETGLDFHYDLKTRDAQIILFQKMLDLAYVHRLPVIVHSREAEDVTTTMLAEHVKRWKDESSRAAPFPEEQCTNLPRQELEIPRGGEKSGENLFRVPPLESPMREGRSPGKSCLPGVLHCFTGSMSFASKLLDLGFFISFSGILTFKNAGDLRSVAAMIPDDRLLIETDSPYLAPEPHRGKTNTPAMVCHVVEALAQIRKSSFEKIAALTTTNAERLFL